MTFLLVFLAILLGFGMLGALSRPRRSYGEEFYDHDYDSGGDCDCGG